MLHPVDFLRGSAAERPALVPGESGAPASRCYSAFVGVNCWCRSDLHKEPSPALWTTSRHWRCWAHAKALAWWYPPS